jgi:hypothetical protein
MPLSLVPNSPDRSTHHPDAACDPGPTAGALGSHAPAPSQPVTAPVVPAGASSAPSEQLPPGDPVGGVPEDLRRALTEQPPWAARVLDLAITAEREAHARSAALQEAASAAATAWRELPREIRELAGRRAPGAPRSFRVAAEFTRGLADGYGWWALHLPVLRQAHDRLPDDAWTTTIANYVRAANNLETDESCAGRDMRAAGRRKANLTVEAELHARTKSLVAAHARSWLARRV